MELLVQAAITLRWHVARLMVARRRLLRVRRARLLSRGRPEPLPPDMACFAAVEVNGVNPCSEGLALPPHEDLEVERV